MVPWTRRHGPTFDGAGPFVRHGATPRVVPRQGGMRLYSDLHRWYPLITPVEDYEEEARDYRDLLGASAAGRRLRILELGAGAGHNAFFLKRDFDLVLTDRSPEMLSLAARLNPELTTVVGDMRTLRLGERFDGVFLHDAVSYLLDEDELAAAFATAAAHLDPGGVFLVTPDELDETVRFGLESGGSDDGKRSARYVECSYQHPTLPGRTCSDFVFVFQEDEGPPQIHRDHHEHGLFPEATWLRLLQDAGFQPRRVVRRPPLEDYPMFVAIKGG